ncbi:putative L-ascorbate peroxidase 3 [Hibiscus syriacus]|uniref:L-ascorbate peroxidase n=1 Tax=Hibiscus syriacus TaxID=106335 RepID=A0A6A2ZAN6_HIBSY|nr:putative L-ascorbate peroxidase 3 [Hibiscus syriacus]
MAFPLVDTEYLKEIDKARRDLRALIALKNCAPIMLRLAWHDAGSYDVSTKTGGPNGFIRNEEEYTHGANNGMKIALDFCEGVKAKHPKITYADLYQLVGVEVTEGSTIGFVPGRKDSNIFPKEGRLPKAKRGAPHLRDIFYRMSRSTMFAYGTPHLRDIFYRMSLSDKDIVSLSGGHTLGRAHPDRSGFDGPCINEPLKFDKSYFVELLKEESEGLLKLPTDRALLDDPEFRKYVELYAKDEDAYFQDYTESHNKLSELGITPSSALSQVERKKSSALPIQVESERKEASTLPIQVERKEASVLPIQVEQNEASALPIQVERKEASALPIQVERKEASALPIQVERKEASALPIQVERKEASTLPIQEAHQVADGFTKPLAKETF